MGTTKRNPCEPSRSETTTAVVGAVLTILLTLSAASPLLAEFTLCLSDDAADSASSGSTNCSEAADDNGSQEGSYFHLADWFNQPAMPPPGLEPTIAPPRRQLARSAQEFALGVLGDTESRTQMIAELRGGTPLPIGPTEFVFGSEGVFRVTTDGANLLEKSIFAPSIRVQPRTPISNDPRVRGSRTGRLLASGSYWAPARMDLDTLLSKIDSRIIQDVVVVKGPYAVNLGPGFTFIDFQLANSPRFACGPEYHGLSSLEWKMNGDQWYGRQTVAGGSDNWGFRIGYGQRAGNDYDTGSSSYDDAGSIPTSYNSMDLDAAVGFDLVDDSRLEFHYLYQGQQNVEYPGLVFDINALVTNGFEVSYEQWDQPGFDHLAIEGWYNRTGFGGDTSRPGKNHQIPAIREDFNLEPDQYLVTDVDGMSAGYRASVTWGEQGCPQLTLGTDLIRVGEQLNDIVPERDMTFDIVIPPGIIIPIDVTLPAQNFPVPRSRSTDVGLFAEYERPTADNWTFRTGARFDAIVTDARNHVPGMGNIQPGLPPVLNEVPLSELKQAELAQQFYPWAVFGVAEYEVNSCCVLNAGAGYAMRPPLLTELYAAGPFIGVLQPGFTFVEGDPELASERMVQLDLGGRLDLGTTRMTVSGFYAWVQDYITYDYIGVPFEPGIEPSQNFLPVAFVNTDLATLGGFELAAEHDANDWLTGFALMSYVAGRDHTRTDPSRVATIIRDSLNMPAGIPRSLNADIESEALPNIPPLEARVGVRLHDPSTDPGWVVEVEARMVDRQDHVARTLFEEPTAGYTVLNVRGYWRPYSDLTLFTGVENFTDRFYREHLDFRSGRGVYRPGINFYFASELVY